MKERLEDLVSDADKMIAEQEAIRDASASVLNEVDRDTAARINEAPREPKLVFWKRYPRAAGLLTCLLLAMIAARIYIIATMPRAIGHYTVVAGIVQSSYLSSRMQGYGSRLAVARVRLPNGNIIAVQVDSGTLLTEGTVVPIRQYDTGAVRLEHSE